MREQRIEAQRWHAALSVRGATSQVIGPQGVVAEVYFSEENANLVAAAPALLAAVDDLAKTLAEAQKAINEDGWPILDADIDRALESSRAAIAAARGGAR